MKIITGVLFSLIYIATASAATIEMFGQEKYGFKQPRYTLKDENSRTNIDFMEIRALAREDNFPYSSQDQGSVFYKIFKDILAKGYTKINLDFEPNKYDKAAINFERGKDKTYNALFGVYYQELPLYQNKYVYPAIAFNNVHLIMPSYKIVAVKSKSGLKEYKGVHASTDKVSDIVAKEFKQLNIKDVEDFPTAFDELLTGKADYMVASYYPSLIEAYKLGIKRYITFSRTPVWRMPIFLRVTPDMMKKSQMERLRSYLKSSDYKKARDAAFKEVIEIYQKNTAGVVPPTYVRVAPIEAKADTSSDENNADIEDAQTE